MTTFRATTEGTDKLGLRAVLERYANDQCLPDYYNEEQRVGIVLTSSNAESNRNGSSWSWKWKKTSHRTASYLRSSNRFRSSEPTMDVDRCVVDRTTLTKRTAIC